MTSPAPVDPSPAAAADVDAGDTDAARRGGRRVSAAVVVTGTEVLTGRVPDANGPWLAERLRERGVEIGRVVVVGDRREDLAASLRFLLADHDLVITSGGLGPTADDLTAEVVAEVQGHAMRRDPQLEERIGEIVERLHAQRGWGRPGEAGLAGIRKQAVVPSGAHVLEPVGTAPGLVVPGTGHDAPPVVVLPGPPGELRPMWDDVLADDLVQAALTGRRELRQETVRLWGPPEADLAAVLREVEQGGGGTLERLEVTTCLRDGELEMVTRFDADDASAYESLLVTVRERFGTAVFSTDGSTVDDVLADLLTGADATVATAESCTAGMLASRLADRPGSSAYLLGGLVTYANEVKTAQLGVAEATLQEVGAVSEEVARAMATAARERLGSTYALSTTGVAGPGGGTADKPVGLVHVALAGPQRVVHRELRLPASRDYVRRRTVVTCLHLLREELVG